jgi:hypothetical protein
MPAKADPEPVKQEGNIVLAHNNGGCTPIRIEGGPMDGVTGIVCGPRTKKRPCITCGKPAGLLCDAPLGTGKKTCSAPMCDEHSTNIGGKDFCHRHMEQAGQTALALKQTKKNAPPENSGQRSLW